MRRSAYPVAIRGYTSALEEAMPVEVLYSPLGRMDAVKRPERFEMLFSRKELPGGFETRPSPGGWRGPVVWIPSTGSSLAPCTTHVRISSSPSCASCRLYRYTTGGPCT